MALRLGALYDALLEATHNAELAQRAAEEVASYERQMADLRSDLRLLLWIASFILAGVVAILFRVYQ